MAETKLKTQAFEAVNLGAWTSFTPSWTNLTAGNGTNSGYYQKIGKAVNIRVFVVFGSTTSMGSTPQLTLPVSIVSASLNAIGRVTCYDQNTGTVYLGYIDGYGSCRIEKVDGTYNTLADITSSVPMTWTTSDVLFIQGTYEAA